MWKTHTFYRSLLIDHFLVKNSMLIYPNVSTRFTCKMPPMTSPVLSAAPPHRPEIQGLEYQGRRPEEVQLDMG